MPNIELIKELIIIFGFIGPMIIAFYMIVFAWTKRCIICGAKMEFKYRKGIVGYACPKCRRLEIKVLK